MTRDIKNRLIQLQGAKNQLLSTISQLESDVATLDSEGVDIQKALLIAQDVAEKTQSKLTVRLGGLVEECIRSVFGDEFEFRVEFETKRNQTEAKLVLIENGVEFDDILNSCGGGVADLVSFALRLACFLIDSRGARRTILLDEPTRNLRLVTDKFYHLIDRLSEELEIQFIIIPSPADEYPESFNCIEVKKTNGRSYVE
jgi:DNA repair exonuclease SbcCD ATPase subunit